jgi:uncharacterized protein
MGLLAIPLGPLRAIVIVLLLAAAALVLVRRKITPHARVTAPGAARALLIAIAFVIGAYDGFFGPGTGTMLVIAFATSFGDPLVRASGNAKVVNLASNLAAMALFASRGTILWHIALPMAAANALGASVGAHLAVKSGDRLVRGTIFVVVLAVVTKLAVDLGR